MVSYSDSYSDLFGDISDHESDEHSVGPSFAQESRITRLGSNIPIPFRFDIPESEGPEANTAADVINSFIMRDQHKPGPSASSATPGKLIRPSSKHYDIKLQSTASRALQGDDSQEPPSKRRKRDHSEDLEVQIQHSGVSRGSKRIRNDRTLRSQEPTKSSLPPSASNKRITRSAVGKQYKESDSVVPVVHNHRSVSKNGSFPVPDGQQSISQSQGQTGIHSKGAVEVLIENTTPTQPLSWVASARNQSRHPTVVAQDTHIMVDPPIAPIDTVQGQASPAHSADRVVSMVSEVNHGQPTIAEEAKVSLAEDSALFVTPEPAGKYVRSQAEVLEQDGEKARELYDPNDPDDFDDNTAEAEDCKNEFDSSDNIYVPAKLKEALEKAHDIHENAESLWRKFADIHILKSYCNLKKIVYRWKSEEDYSKTEKLIRLSNKITKEAETILKKSGWDQHRGLEYIYKRVLPTLVRMSYISMVYYLSEIKTLENLSYDPLKELSSVVMAVLSLSNQAKDANTEYTRPRAAIAMVARMRKVRDILDERLRAFDLAKAAAKSAQRQRTQQLRQTAVDREEEYEKQLMMWREHWRLLHDQRLGAELEGRTRLSREQDQHLRQIPLEDPQVPSPCWDPEMHVYPLTEGLQKLAGPNVYRDIFRKYCRHGGPLQAFNVAEIVDKAVSLKEQLTRLAAEDGDELDQWVSDIYDPRERPVDLRQSEGRS